MIKMQKVGKDKLYVGVIIVLAVAVSVLVLQSPKSMPAEVQGVRDIYKILTEQDAEILSVKDESGLYKVAVRVTDVTGRSAVQDVFITKDGVLFTDQPLIKVGDFIATLNKQKNFSLCLSTANVRLLGQGNDLTGFRQLLGSFTGSIYFDCGASQQNLQQCQQAGVQSVPAVVFNNTIYPGFRDVNFISSLTGCAL